MLCFLLLLLASIYFQGKQFSNCWFRFAFFSLLPHGLHLVWGFCYEFIDKMKVFMIFFYRWFIKILKLSERLHRRFDNQQYYLIYEDLRLTASPEPPYENLHLDGFTCTTFKIRKPFFRSMHNSLTR